MPLLSKPFKARRKGRRLILENLEDRLLFAGLTGEHVLAEATGSIAADVTRELNLSVERTRDSVVLGLLMSAADGSSLDPAAIEASQIYRLTSATTGNSQSRVQDYQGPEPFHNEIARADG